MHARTQAPPRGLHPRTATEESLRDAVGVVGSELSEELALNSSELRLSEASLSPLLMELLSSQLRTGERRVSSPKGKCVFHGGGRAVSWAWVCR